MLRNYLTVAIRNLLRHKVYSLINVAGLAIALMCCILVFLFVEDELSYDRYHENADRIYKVVRQDAALTPGPLAAALLSDFPEVVSAARIASGFGKMLVSYGERSFYEKQFLFADASVFDIFTFPFIKGDPGTALREPNTIVITRDMARKYFGGEDPLGKTLRVSEMGNWYDYEVTGVLQNIPHNSHFRFDFLASIMPFGESRSIGYWGNWNFHTYLLLPPDYLPDRLEKQLSDFLKRHFRRARWDAQLQLQPLTGIHLYSHLGHELEPNSNDDEQVVVINTDNVEAKERRRLLGAYRNEILPHHNIIRMASASRSFGGRLESTGFEYEGVQRRLYRFFIDHNYLETLGIKLAEGRNFSEDFPADEKESLIINESLAREFGLASPVGNPLEVYDRGGSPLTVIGVVKDYHFQDLHQDIKPLVLHLSSTSYGARCAFIRIRPQDIPSTLGFLRVKWRQIFPGYPFEYSFLDEDVDRQYRSEERWGRIVRYSALLALFIACLGTFGQTSLAVARRTKEIGIRKVLGASVSSIVSLLSREFMILVALASVIAWPVAYYAMDRWLQEFAYRISLGPGMFAVGAVLTLTVVLLTVVSLAVKAALSNPVDALRYE